MQVKIQTQINVRGFALKRICLVLEEYSQNSQNVFPSLTIQLIRNCPQSV